MNFTAPQELVEVDLEYVELGNGDVIIIFNDAQRSLMKDKVKVAKAKFQRPKFGNFRHYIKGVVQEGANGEDLLDKMLLKTQKFNVLLVELVDGDGKTVDLIPSFYHNLIPEFAMGFIDKYDAVLETERLEMLTNLGIFDNEELVNESAELIEEEKEEEKEDADEDLSK